MRVTVYSDYTCGDTYRVKKMIDQLGSGKPENLRWSPFSIKERNLVEGETSLFERGGIDSFSVLALALSQAVPSERFPDFHDEVFEALHEGSDLLSHDDLFEIAARAGVERREFEATEERWLKEVAGAHRDAVERGIFGAPTFAFESSGSVYVELRQAPESPEEAGAIWDRIVDAAGAPASLALIRRLD